VVAAATFRIFVIPTLDMVFQWLRAQLASASDRQPGGRGGGQSGRSARGCRI